MLVELDLSDNPLTEHAANGLASIIRHQTSLKILNLNDTCLGDAGVNVVASSLVGSVPDLEVYIMELCKCYIQFVLC